MLEMQELFYR